MASYDVVAKPAVAKDLRALPKADAARLLSAIERLAREPRSSRSVKLSGTERLYRQRVGVYRIVYEIDDVGRAVIVHYVRHRRDVYRRI